MKLSVCLAVHNESTNLHYSLGSVIDWVDEVVVVDGGSTDDTVDRCRAYGQKVRIISTTNVPMFHRMKQMALDAAQGEWILQLDADEEITPELKKEILGSTEYKVQSTEEHNEDTILAYQIPRRNYFLGRFLMKGGVYPDYTIRLYRRGTMYFPCKDVHENVMPVQSTEYKVQSERWLGTMKNPMNHYSDPTFARYWHRWKRYCTIEASRVEENALRLYEDKKKYVTWKIIFVLRCIFVLPIYWFFLSYFRHKGFMDGWQGLVFHFMSAMRWWGIAVAVWRLQSE